MERIRQLYQTAEEGDALEQRSALFYATTLFERMVWLLRQVGLSLKTAPPQGFVAITSSSVASSRHRDQEKYHHL